MGNCFALCINSCTSTVSTTQSKNITEFTMPILAKDVEEEAQFSGGALTNKACNLSSPIQNVAVISADSDTEQTGTTMKRIKVIITKQQLQNLLSNQGRVEDFLSFSAGGGGPHPEAGSSSTKPRLHSIPEETELSCSIL